MEDYSQDTIQQREIHSVTEINQTASDFLNEAFPPVWVAGEISNFREYGTSGHWYFSIKDSNSVLSCTMFRLQNNSLRFKPKEGDQVILQGKLSIYAKSGRYQLITSKMELAGFGELMRKYELLKNKLNSEGLFTKKSDEGIPEIINNVAVLTSKHGAAVRDVISTLQRRAPHIRITIVPCKVQGDGSAESIIKSLETVELNHKKQAYDAVILCRGGGSIEDLWSFNDERLCRQIANSPIPIISGVGHETDFTLTDFVSNLRAATPTAAAEIVSEGASNLRDFLTYLKERLVKEMKNNISSARENISTLQRLLRSPKQRLEEQYQRLDLATDRLLVNNKLNFNNKRSNFQIIKTQLESLSPVMEIKNQKSMIINLFKSLLEKQQTILRNKKQDMKLMQEKLIALNPSQILNRGYSITFNEQGEAVNNPDKLHDGEIVTTQLAKGKFKSRVEN
ncbi:MAG: exodeoxyribonuclease VII large subunit [Gammaproteobacteria bacterium]|nr:exodeoxyribonuclease VII large subunit [Gammaproteobacteria bacterium]